MFQSDIKGSQLDYAIYTAMKPISNWEGPEAMAYPIQLSPFRIWPFFFSFFLSRNLTFTSTVLKTGCYSVVTTHSDKYMFNESTVNTDCSRLPFSQQKNKWRAYECSLVGWCGCVEYIEQKSPPPNCVPFVPEPGIEPGAFRCLYISIYLQSDALPTELFRRTNADWRMRPVDRIRVYLLLTDK